MLDLELDVRLNHVDYRRIGFKQDVLHKDNIVITHSNKNGVMSKTQYVIDKYQAIKMANAILNHYKEASNNEGR